MFILVLDQSHDPPPHPSLDSAIAAQAGSSELGAHLGLLCAVRVTLIVVPTFKFAMVV